MRDKFLNSISNLSQWSLFKAFVRGGKFFTYVNLTQDNSALCAMWTFNKRFETHYNVFISRYKDIWVFINVWSTILSDEDEDVCIFTTVCNGFCCTVINYLLIHQHPLTGGQQLQLFTNKYKHLYVLTMLTTIIVCCKPFIKSSMLLMNIAKHSCSIRQMKPCFFFLVLSPDSWWCTAELFISGSAGHQ